MNTNAMPPAYPNPKYETTPSFHPQPQPVYQTTPSFHSQPQPAYQTPPAQHPQQAPQAQRLTSAQIGEQFRSERAPPMLPAPVPAKISCGCVI